MSKTMGMPNVGFGVRPSSRLVVLGTLVLFIVAVAMETTASGAVETMRDGRVLSASHQLTSLRPGQYYYTEVFDHTSNPATVQTWVAANGSGRRVTTMDPFRKWSTTAERAASVAEGNPRFPVPGFERTAQGFGAGYAFTSNPTIQLFNLSHLPTEPTTVAQLIARGHTGSPKPGQTPLSGLIQVGYDCSTGSSACVDLARTALLLQGPDEASTAARRSALVRAATDIPGVSVIKDVADPVGQRGLELRLVEHSRPYKEGYTCEDSNGHITAKGTYAVSSATSRFTLIVNTKTWTLLSSASSFAGAQSPNECGFSPTSPGPHLIGKVGGEATEQPLVISGWRLLLHSGVVNSNSATP
jgi:hypothetical protein